MVWLMAFLPFAYLMPNHYQPWLSFHSDWLAGIAFAPMFLWVCVMSPKSVPNIALVAVFLGGGAFLQYALGVVYYFGDAAIFCLYMLGFAMSVAFGWHLQSFNFASERPLFLAGENYIWIPIALAGLISSGVGLYQFFELDYSAVFIVTAVDRHRMTANLAQPNQLASLLSLAIISGMALFRNTLISKKVLIAFTIIVVLGLAGTKSRVGVLFLILLSLYGWIYKEVASKFTLQCALFCSTLYIIFTLLLPWLSQVIMLGESISMLERTTASSRIEIIKIVFDAISHESSFGFGVNQISLAQLSAFTGRESLNFVFESSHNIFLDFVLVWGWFVGGALSLYLIFWYIRRMCVLENENTLFLLLAISVLSLHAMVEFPLNYAYFLLPFGLWIGCLEGKQKKCSQTGFFNIPKLIWPILSIVTLAGFVLVGIDYYRVESAWKELRYSLAQFKGSHSDNSIDSVIFNQFDDLIKYSGRPIAKELDDEDLNRMKIAAMRFNYAAINFKYAVISGINGRPHEAVFALSSLCAMQPKPICKKSLDEWSYYADTIWPELKSIDISRVKR
jgi:hypothetical protein